MRKKLYIFLASVVFSIVLWGSISLSDNYYTNIDVKLSLVNFPDGYTTGSPIPDKIKLRVKGRGWKLLSLNVGPESEFVVTAGKDSGWHTISLYNYLESNRWLLSDVDIINILPDSLRFFVERTMTKKLLVIPDLNLKFKPGYGLATEIMLKPDSVMVTGPVSYLKPLKEINTENKTFGPLDTRTESEVGLPNKNGFTYNTNIINVLLNVQKIVDKQFDNIVVEVTNVPAGKEVVLLPNKISLNLRGGIDILGKLNENQLHANIKYQDLVVDTTGSVAPVIQIPKDVTLQYLKPERLRYIIRSF